MTIKYHFFGKDCIINRELSQRADLERCLSEKNFKTRANLFVNQVHGSEVVVVDAENKIHGNQDLPKADALVTNLKNVVIGIITADCSPILFFDEEKKIIGAAHAGWRGAKSGVIAATVEKMKNLGAKKISALIGPMIQQKSYEVSQEFFDDFVGEEAMNSIFFEKGAQPGKYWFNLNSYVEKKLHEAGVSDIKNDKIDTYSNEKDLFSFRRSTHRSENDCGRNVSVICLE